ncbi:MAG: hypothetical protein AAF532_11755 [Planctomycetota bacterium]
MLTLAAGCGESEPIATVSGLVTVGGTPAANVYLEFQPQGEGARSIAFADEEGRFDLMVATGNFRRGAFVGPHEVTILGAENVDSFKYWEQPLDESGTPQPSSKPRPTVEVPQAGMPLQFEVPPGGTSSADFAL